MNKAFFGMAMMTAFGLASCANKPAQQQEEAASETAAASNNEIRINCLYKVAPENVANIVTLSKELVAASRNDGGNIDYDIYQSQTDPTQLMIFETWKDQASLDVHSAAAHFTRIVPQLANAAVGEMAIQSFTQTSEGSQIRINCMLKVDAANVTKALGLAKELVEASRKDDGNIDYDIYQSQTDPTQMMNMGMGEVIADISGGGDISCYPHLESLTAQFNQFSIKSHLGYSCGKGISDREIASRLINNGVEEATFTVFSTDPKLRQQWVRDKHPQEALNACRIFCENIKLTGASVIIPGVNDGDVLRQTCDDLESWGAKGFILMRFANTFNEGLILGNEPILKDHESQPVEEFGQLVKDLNNEYNFRITGTPLCDPETGGPFAIAKDENQIFLQFIKPVTGEATIITSKIAAPYIQNIFDKLEVERDDDVYLNKSSLNYLKNEACRLLQERIAASFKRKSREYEYVKAASEGCKERKLTIRVRNNEQFTASVFDPCSRHYI